MLKRIQGGRSRVKTMMSAVAKIKQRAGKAGKASRTATGSSGPHELPKWFRDAAKESMGFEILTVSAALEYCKKQYDARKIKIPDPEKTEAEPGELLLGCFDRAVETFNEAQGRKDGNRVLGVILVCIAGVQDKDERTEAPKREGGAVWGLPMTTFDSTALPEEFDFSTYKSTGSNSDNDLDVAAAALQECGLISRFMKPRRPTIAKIGPSRSEGKVARAMGKAFSKPEND